MLPFGTSWHRWMMIVLFYFRILATQSLATLVGDFILTMKYLWILTETHDDTQNIYICCFSRTNLLLALQMVVAVKQLLLG